MKKTLLLVTILSVVRISSFSQNGQPVAKPQNMHEYNDFNKLMERSDKLKTAGWVLMGTGSVLMITGILVYNANINTGLWGDFNALPGAFCMALGGGAMISGGALLGTSTHYKHKALNLSGFIRQEKFPTLQGSVVGMHPVPALGFRLNF